MLLSLSIRNLVLIEKLDLAFDEGLTVFTGETGAGKSMLLDGLSLIIGGRFDPGLVRHTGDPLFVSAVFQGSNSAASLLMESMIEASDEGDDLIVRRVVDEKCKGKAFINDQVVTANFLKQLGQLNLDIHGQFDRFMTPGQYRILLDQFGGHETLVKEVEQSYHAWQEALAVVTSLKTRQGVMDDRREELIFLCAELDTTKPKPKEEETLLKERETLKQATHNAHALKQATLYFDEGMTADLIGLQKILAKCEGDETLCARLDPIILELSDIESDVRHKASLSDVDPEHLNTLDERLHLLRQLARKHKVAVDELYVVQDMLQTELDALLHVGEAIDTAEKVAMMHENNFVEAATMLHQKRVDAGQKLSHAIAQELPSLKLGEAHFKIDVQHLDLVDGTEYGLDVIEFLFSANPGMALQPMAKVASGGELSRLMLALKVALSSLLKECRTQTLLFDEIDSGVGGATATAIGSRLKRLSSQQQVIAITHSPQVAAFADHHYKVMKSVVGGETFVGIEKLEGRVRDAELARMLSGEVMTDEALKAAQSLIHQAQDMFNKRSYRC